ncbi:MAG TPA: hypothetical protein VIC86_11160 [Acidimicrobiales bacterium]
MPSHHHQPAPAAAPSAQPEPSLPAEPLGAAWSDSRDGEPGPLAEALLDHLPEFLPTYRRLVEACDDDPGEPVLLMELADLVSAHLAAQAVGRSLLERALGVIEGLIDSLAGDEIRRELVGIAFFDSFSPESRRLLAPWLGPQSIEVLEALEASPL